MSYITIYDVCLLCSGGVFNIFPSPPGPKIQTKIQNKKLIPP
jgi:hypothetical protein